MFIFFLFLVIVVIIVIGFLDKFGFVKWNKAITPAIAIASLILSLLVAFGKPLVPFSLRTGSALGGIYFVDDFKPKAPGIILPIQLSNETYGEGAVDYIWIKITNPDKKKYIYRPNAIIDPKRFITDNQRNLNVSSFENIGYSPIHLDSFEINQPNILFLNKDEGNLWTEGEYTLELFVKLSNKKIATKIDQVKYVLDDTRLTNIKKQKLYFPLRDYSEIVNSTK